MIPAMTFESAKTLLMGACADVLVTELELDQLSGFYLAILARVNMRDVRTVVIGPVEDLMEQDLRMIGASCVTPGDIQALVDAVREAIVRDQPRRRWSRRQPHADVILEIDGQPARVVDMSYGGVRVEVSVKPSAVSPGTVVIAVPQHDLQEPATSRWMRSIDRDVYWRGLAIDANQTGPGSRWRAIVDELAPAAALAQP